MNLLGRIRKICAENSGTATEDIGRYVLDHYVSVYRCSTKELSEKIGTSKAALVRFSKKLGFHGWKDFIACLIDEENLYVDQFTDVDPNVPFSSSTSLENVISTVVTLEAESVLDTEDMIRAGKVMQAAAMMKNAQRIVVLTLAPNSPNIDFARIFRRSMAEIGRSIEIHDGLDGRLVANTLTEKDLAIIISYKGIPQGYDACRMLEILKKNKVKMIAVTGNFDSPLQSCADVVMHVVSREDRFGKISSFSSNASILTVLNVLYAVYFHANYLENFEYKKLTDRSIQQGLS